MSASNKNIPLNNFSEWRTIFFFYNMNSVSVLTGSSFMTFDIYIDHVLLIYPLQEAEGVGHELPCAVRTWYVYYRTTFSNTYSY